MRFWRGMIAGALALGGLAFAQGSASAAEMTAPQLTHVTPVAAAQASSSVAPTCYRPYRPYRRYGWRRHYWHPYYGYGYRRPWVRPYYRRPYFHRRLYY